VLSHGNRLFDEVPKVLRDGWAKSYPQTKGVCIMLHKDNKEERNAEKRNQMVHEYVGMRDAQCAYLAT
jgi:hypothetical protein